MATSSSFTIDPAEFAKLRPPVQGLPERVGPGSYTLTGCRQYAITNLGADGSVVVDGVALPQAFTYESALLEPGAVYADVVVTVTAHEAFISTQT